VVVGIITSKSGCGHDRGGNEGTTVRLGGDGCRQEEDARTGNRERGPRAHSGCNAGRKSTPEGRTGLELDVGAQIRLGELVWEEGLKMFQVEGDIRDAHWTMQSPSIHSSLTPINPNNTILHVFCNLLRVLL